MTARVLRFLAIAHLFVFFTHPAWADANGTWRRIVDIPDNAVELAGFDATHRRMWAFSGGVIRSFDVDAEGPWERVVADGSALGPHFGYALAYDDLANRIFLFGGQDAGDTLTNDVWELPLDDPTPAWVKVNVTAPAIEERRDAHAIFDSNSNRLIVYGGTIVHPLFGNVTVNDVWALDVDTPSTWTRLAAHAPGSFGYSTETSVLFDAGHDRLVAFDNGSSPDVWRFELNGDTTWTKLSGAGANPGSRLSPQVVVDPIGDRLVLYGGYGKSIPCCGSGPGSYDDTWAFLFATNTWTSLLSSGPEGRRNAGAAYDPVGRTMIIVGGIYDELWHTGDPHDVRTVPEAWRLSLSAPMNWTFFASNSSPVFTDAGVWDSKRKRVVMPQGPKTSLPAGIWSLAGDDRWRYEPTTGSAPGLRALSYDADADEVFGVTVAGTQFWRLNLSTRTWSMQPIANAPPSLANSIRWAFDSPTRRIYALALATDPTYHVDYVGVFSTPVDPPHAWTETPPSGALLPGLGAPESGTGFFSDVLRDRILAFDSDVMSLTPWLAPIWNYLGPLGYGGSSSSSLPQPASAVTKWSYDARRDRMVFFSGQVPGSLGPSYMLRDWYLDGLMSNDLNAAGPQPGGRFTFMQVADPWNDRLVVYGGFARHLWYTDTWVLEWSNPMQPTTTGGPDIVWNPGQSSLAEYTVTNASSTAGTLDYALESARGWPGYPITGQLALAGNATVPLELLAPVPDTVASGANVLTLRIWETGAPALAQVLTRHIHDSTTPTVLSFVDATYDDGAATITWWSPDGGSAHGTVERRVGDGAWAAIAQVVGDGGGRLVYVDRDLVPGARYGYRLAWADAHGAMQWSEATAIDVPASALVFALLPPRSSPMVGTIAVRFTIAAAGDATLEVYDVRGRRVAHEKIADAAPGSYERVPAGAERLRSGVYFVRLVQGAREARQRCVLLGAGN